MRDVESYKSSSHHDILRVHRPDLNHTGLTAHGQRTSMTEHNLPDTISLLSRTPAALDAFVLETAHAEGQPVLFHSVEPVKIGKGSRYALGSRTFGFVFLLSQRKQLNVSCIVPGWRERLSRVDRIAPSTACLRGLSGHCSTLWSRWCSDANHSVLNSRIPA